MKNQIIPYSWWSHSTSKTSWLFCSDKIILWIFLFCLAWSHLHLETYWKFGIFSDSVRDISLCHTNQKRSSITPVVVVTAYLIKPRKPREYLLSHILFSRLLLSKKSMIGIFIIRWISLNIIYTRYR